MLFCLARELAQEGVKLNITAMFTEEQVTGVAKALNPQVPAVVSVFAGRIADVGQDPMPHMRNAAKILADLSQTELLWASVREVLNIVQAEECGCKIVTVPHDILNKAMIAALGSCCSCANCNTSTPSFSAARVMKNGNSSQCGRHSFHRIRDNPASKQAGRKSVLSIKHDDRF